MKLPTSLKFTRDVIIDNVFMGANGGVDIIFKDVETGEFLLSALAPDPLVYPLGGNEEDDLADESTGR